MNKIEERQEAMRIRQRARKPVDCVVVERNEATLSPTKQPRSTTVETPPIVRPWPRLLTIELAADYVGVSRSTIDEWVAEGKLHPFPLPGIRGRPRLEKIVFEKRELERFLGLRPE